MHNPFDQSHRDFTIASTNIYNKKEKEKTEIKCASSSGFERKIFEFAIKEMRQS